MDPRHSGVVHMRIGKNGVTDGAVEEIRQQIERTDPLIIKFLKSFTDEHDRKEAAADLAQRTGTHVRSLTGGTLVLTRKR